MKNLLKIATKYKKALDKPMVGRYNEKEDRGAYDKSTVGSCAPAKLKQFKNLLEITQSQNVYMYSLLCSLNSRT